MANGLVQHITVEEPTSIQWVIASSSGLNPSEGIIITKKL